MPILGRKFEDLLTLTPGVSIVQGPDGDEITFAGQRGVFNNISLDGGDFNNGFFGEQAGGQRAPNRHHARRGQGVPGDCERRARGVRPHRGRRRERHHEVRWQRPQRLGVLFPAVRGADGRFVGRHEARGLSSRAVRRHDRRSDPAGQGVLSSPHSRASPATSSGRISAAPIGTPCPVSNPTIPAECGADQRRARLPACGAAQFLSDASRHGRRAAARPSDQDVCDAAEGRRKHRRGNRLSTSYNFNHSRKENETFDVATYGTSANGTEGDPARINVLNTNVFTTFANNKLNEFHFTYSRETRPRTANESNLAADTGIGFSPSFRFGNPFFMQPNVTS